jgi:quinol monooxygenase YgiN
MTTIVHFEIQLDPAKLADASEILSETLAATRAWPGNEGLEVLVSDDDPANMIVVEKWASTIDHTRYVEWRATPEGGGGRIRELLAAPPTTRVFSEQLRLTLAE